MPTEAIGCDTSDNARLKAILVKTQAKPLLLFLDEEGVLETPSNEDFVPMQHLPEVERCVLSIPELYVVLSTPRREEFGLSDLVADFSPELRARIIGVLPVLANGRAAGGREAEAHLWMQTHLEGAKPDWFAVDDEPQLWVSGSRLIAVDGHKGFDKEAACRLTEGVAELRAVPALEQTRGLSELTQPPVGVRAVLGTVTDWHPEVGTGFARVPGRRQPLAFKARTAASGFSPVKGQQVQLWLNRESCVVHVRA